MELSLEPIRWVILLLAVLNFRVKLQEILLVSSLESCASLCCTFVVACAKCWFSLVLKPDLDFVATSCFCDVL
jgi:hypothetical protein